MNRRRFIETALCASVIPALPDNIWAKEASANQMARAIVERFNAKHDWIVLAHVGRTSNRTVYTKDNLEDMRGYIVGKHVFSEDGVGLESLRGVVKDCRLDETTLEVKVAWFSNAPKGRFYLTPIGFAEGHTFALYSDFGGTSDVNFTHYKLEHISLSRSSSFVHATQFEL